MNIQFPHLIRMNTAIISGTKNSERWPNCSSYDQRQVGATHLPNGIALQCITPMLGAYAVQHLVKNSSVMLRANLKQEFGDTKGIPETVVRSDGNVQETLKESVGKPESYLKTTLNKLRHSILASSQYFQGGDCWRLGEYGKRHICSSSFQGD